MLVVVYPRCVSLLILLCRLDYAKKKGKMIIFISEPMYAIMVIIFSCRFRRLIYSGSLTKGTPFKAAGEFQMLYFYALLAVGCLLGAALITGTIEGADAIFFYIDFFGEATWLGISS